MKKILFFIIIFTYSYSFEPYLEVDTDYRLQNYHESYPYYKVIGGVKHSGDFYYLELSGIAEYDYDPVVDLYRGYVDLYYKDYSISIGRQSINWGSGYAFNLANTFYVQELLDPKAERRGVDSVYLKYSSPNMSRLEFAYFKSDINTGVKSDNFGSRYTFVVDNFEFMANYFYIKQHLPNSMLIESNNKLVLEAKGDIGIGIWGQLGYDHFQSVDYVSGVIGADYNFDISEHSLYTVIESEYNEYVTALFLSYDFSINEDLSFKQGYTLINHDWFITNVVTYTYNDYLEFQFIYNFFHYDENIKFYTHNRDEALNNEITFRISIYL